MRISDWSSDVCSSDLVVDDEIGEDDHVAALFGDPLGAFLAETGGQILLDRLDLALAFLAPQRNPVGDWPAPGREIFNDRMAVSKIVARPGETRAVRLTIGVQIGRASCWDRECQ